MRRIRTVLLAALVSGAAGCVDGRVELFTVTPNPACEGEHVAIAYITGAGEPILETSQPVPGLDFAAHRRQDVLTITADDNLTITFTARGSGSSETRSIALVVRDPDQPVMLAAGGTCPGPTWRQVLRADQWPTTAEVVLVTNLDPSPVRVTHGGRTRQLGPARSGTATSADFATLPLAGDWDLQPDSAAGVCPPGCGTTGDDCPTFPPHRVEVVWRCGAR